MSHWSFWDILAYASIAFSALVMAVREYSKDMTFPNWIPTFIEKINWAYVPIFLIIISLVIFIAKELGWIGTTPPTALNAKSTMPCKETMIKLAINQSNKAQFDEVEKKNIYKFGQLAFTGAIKVVKTGEINPYTKEHVFFIIFETNIDCGEAKVNSFGHEFPWFNFYAFGDRGGILHIHGEIKAPIFEIHFLPKIINLN
jgi:hypothetical protein